MLLVRKNVAKQILHVKKSGNQFIFVRKFQLLFVRKVLSLFALADSDR